MDVLRRIWVVPAAAVLLAACDDGGLVSPDKQGGEATAYLSCRVDVQGGVLSCNGQDLSGTGGAIGAIIGGQNVYVQLASNGVAYDEANEVFSASVTVKNLSSQVLGSSDGVTPHANGVRVFFVGEPAVQGTGTVTLANADGVASFTGSDQPYFEYAQAITAGQTSLPRTWEWHVPSTVTSFSFLVGVSAEVADEAGLAPDLKFIASTMAAESLHTCVLKLNGQAYCWGRQNYGKLGNGGSGNVPVLTPDSVLQGELRFVSLAAGLHHTCAIERSGDVWCWGTGENGRMGIGDTISTTAWFNRPVKVIGGHKFIQIVAGRRFTCGLTVDHDAYCWGANQQGYSPLGDGVVAVDRWAPHPVQGGRKFASLGAGKYHTCGITLDGETYCWGMGTNGRLGTGDTVNTTVPTKVVGGLRFAKIDGGVASTCALTVEGEAYCWGSASTHHKLGALDENGEPISSTVVPEPIKVTTDLRFVDIEVGPYHACGLATDGKAYCWGHDNRGRLGVGEDFPGNTAPTPTPVVGGHTFIEIITGLEHNCGKTPAQEIYCWGDGSEGQVGHGAQGYVWSPVKITLP